MASRWHTTLDVSHPDEISSWCRWSGRLDSSTGWLMANSACQSNDMRQRTKSSGWPNGICVSHRDCLAHGGICQGWVTNNSASHMDATHKHLGVILMGLQIFQILTIPSGLQRFRACVCGGKIRVRNLIFWPVTFWKYLEFPCRHKCSSYIHMCADPF